LHALSAIISIAYRHARECLYKRVSIYYDIVYDVETIMDKIALGEILVLINN